MSGWVRRSFAATGVTQYPIGAHLAALQARAGGYVVLCVDVSSSMNSRADTHRSRIEAALAGALGFVDEARAAQYQVGLVLWNHEVVRQVTPSADPKPVVEALRSARAGGGTNITPTLRLGVQTLGPLRGDRVLAIFGDGDLGPIESALAAAEDARRVGIRIVVRGLGQRAAAQLERIATDEDPDSTVQEGSDIEQSIISMARGIAIRRNRSR